ncbi:AtpZ/AtpI family protein [Gilvibacter sp.]|uniref:AtpZ/AtpI family protein n=1 Tax=Gilvibacter sp. TaxID=2729997 RepID=UPI0035BE9EB6
MLKRGLILTGIAAEMGLIIYLFVRLGKWLDTQYDMGKWGLIICTLSGVGIAMALVVRQTKSLHKE